MAKKTQKQKSSVRLYQILMGVIAIIMIISMIAAAIG